MYILYRENMTILILLFRMSSQSRGASLSKKIISIQRNNNYKKCGLYSVASPPWAAADYWFIKVFYVIKFGFFFSRSVGVRPSSRPPPSRPTSTSPRRSRHVILRRRSASRSTASRSGSKAPSRRNRYTSVVQFSTSLVNVLYIVILVSLLSEDISFRLFWKTRRFEVS